MNKQVVLEKRPIEFPSQDTWSWSEAEIPNISDGEFLVKVKYISLDPAMRGWMNDQKSYVKPIELGEVMRAGGVGEVIQSRHERFAVGDFVCGLTGVQQYCLTEGKGFYHVDPKSVPLQTYLGLLGMPGFTAYFGLLDIGAPQEGETVLVSAAAGAVGSAVGQIAKIKGCRVVGVAGGAKKCDYVVNELGFDACVDYKNEDIYVEIKKHCPQGIDIYFDNVGGIILETALAQLNFKGRIPLCGAISQYNAASIKGPRNYLSLLVNSAKMEGFIVMNYSKRYPEAMAQLAAWYSEGRLKSNEHIEVGIDQFYSAFCKLFSGEKMGKMVLKVE